MLASLRLASRQCPPYPRTASVYRFASTDVQFPSSSSSSGSGAGPGSSQPSVSDPQPRGTTADPSTSTPNPNKPSSQYDQCQQQRVEGAPMIPSAAASPPPAPPPQSESQSHPYAGARSYEENQESSKNAVVQSNLPALPQRNTTNEGQYMHTYATPPFDTHRFFRALEGTFPEPIASSLMRATRALLVDRIGRVKREALSSKDLENQAYLFRAALSEARNEISLRQRNDSASIRTSLAVLRREIDNLEGKMKSDIANVKHELQMDVDNRKTESKTDLKQIDIRIEEALNKAIVSIGEMRTSTEQMKWENMYRSVLALGCFSLAIVIIFEYSHAIKTPSSSKPATTIGGQNTVIEGLEMQMT